MSMMIFVLSLASAASPAVSNPQPAAQPANQVAQAVRSPNAPRKYCIASEAITGSRMTRGKEVCRTKAEWAREGIDVDDL